MKLFINKDFFNAPKPPAVYLCNTAKKIIGELPATNRSGNFKWNSYSEISFEVPRFYVDMLTGETKVHPLYDKVEAPRNVLLKNYGYFALQDIDDTSNDNDIKNVTAFSLEYTVSNKYLTNFHINTGEVDSKEVLYNEEKYGIDYNTDRDSFYTFASGAFNTFEKYYQRNYTDEDSYTYEQIQIEDENKYNELLAKSNADYAQLADKLYVKKFKNVQFYDINNPGLSLLHLVFENIPEWKIGNVDQSLWLRERKFSEDRISVYDFLMNNVSETFGCTFVWDSLTGLVHCYEEVEDDEIENEASTRFETDVYISKDNLASECKVNYSSDNIKTKLVVTGSDDLDIREVNLGRNEIMDLSFYHTEDWMEQDLFDRYGDYLEEVKEAQTGLNSNGLPSDKYPISYPDAVQGWVAANNRYHELMHTVPTEDNVLLVGDEFKKLFCIYTPIDTAYADEDIINDITISTKFIDGPLYYDKQLTVPITNIDDKEIFIVGGFKLQYIKQNNQFQVMENLATTSTNALIKKLNQYHVDEDVDANKNDNIFLKLRNSSSDVATIRIYDEKAYISKSSGSDYNSYYNYYTITDKGKYEKLRITNQLELDERINNSEGGVYTNNYKIQSIIIRASSGVSEAPDVFTLSEWVNGELTAEKMGLRSENEKYTVTYIGTMGAYFVLAKDEVVVTDDSVLKISEDYLQSCGINLLKEKHKVYTSIFQTQTEAMFSQEKYQCIVQDTQPEGDYKHGTIWLDTNDGGATRYIYDADTHEWVKFDDNDIDVSQEDQYNYENYQRYLDNYNKLRAVQKVLTQKEREATYCLGGYKVDSKKIDFSLYTRTVDDNGDGKIDEKDVLRYNGQTLEGDMHRAAEAHFCGVDAYASQVVDGSSKWNIIEDLYLKAYKDDNGVRKVSNKIDKENLQPGVKYRVDGYAYQYDSSTNSFKRIFVDYYITRKSMSQIFPLYTFTTSFDPITYAKNTKSYSSIEQYYTKHETMATYTPVVIEDEDAFKKYDGSTNAKTLYIQTSGHTFAVYLDGTTPCVAYANSVGVYQMIRDYIRDKTEMSEFFKEGDLWVRLSPFIKEDEFNDSNFLLTGYESEEERISICEELMESAAKELKTLCKPSLEFSMTMANILALPEFEPLVEQFQLGNFIRVEIRDRYVKRTRLLEVNLNFDDLSDFNCTFGNLVSVKSEIDKHAELLSQAVSAGKQVAKSGTNWQKSVEKTNKIESDIATGLQDAALKIRNASGQSVEISDNGLIGRKLIEGTTDQYEDEQVALINNKLVFTADNWNTSKSAFGKFEFQGQERWGVLSDAVVSGYISGSVIEGGNLKIGGTGGTFIVNEDGSVQILGPENEELYAGKALENAYRFQTRLTYDGLTIFTDINHECTITCHVYDTNKPIVDKGIEDQEITAEVISKGGTFTWNRALSGSNSDWEPTLVDGKPNVILIKRKDVERNAQFDCVVEFDETKFNE